MRISAAVLVATTAGGLALALTACTEMPSEPAVTPHVNASPAASSTPTAAATATAKVDPTAYVTSARQIGFDSADGNIHCAIFTVPDLAEWAPQAGCAMDAWNFEFPVVPFVDAVAPGNATVLRGPGEGQVVAHSDAPYPGQDTYNYPDVGALAPGESIAAQGITCEADDASILCTNDETGHGFTISRLDYEVH